MNKINQIVKEMLEQHGGGENFFTHLDEAIQDGDIISQLLKLASNENTDGLIVSGKFGSFLINYLSNLDYDLNIFRVIVVNGGLRKGEPVDNLDYIRDEISGKRFDFVDDSYYSGKTRNAIEKELARQGAELVDTYVVYDGSKIRRKNVFSLYRYYDHHRVTYDIRDVIENCNKCKCYNCKMTHDKKSLCYYNCFENCKGLRPKDTTAWYCFDPKIN